MARSSPVVSLMLLGLAALCTQRILSFVGPGPSTTSRAPSVARRAEAEEEVEEYVPAPGDRLKLKVLSPEGDGISVACSEVILPSATGQLGILANHAPMMSALDTGVLRFKEDGKWKPLVVMGGFATVDSNQLSVLVNDFEKAESIDMTEAQSEMDSATSMLEKADSKKDKLEATTKVKRAAARLQAAMFASKITTCNAWNFQGGVTPWNSRKYSSPLTPQNFENHIISSCLLHFMCLFPHLVVQRAKKR